MSYIIEEAASPEEVLRAFNVSRESSEQLYAYVSLLLKWQSRINLIGPKESERLWSRHIADGLQLLGYCPENITSVADLGSGAGIPGLIMAIGMEKPDVEFHLVESNGKKAAFLREVSRRLGLNVFVHADRIENLYGQDWVEGVDVVVARALAPLVDLVELAKPFVEKSGEMLFLKGLDVDMELTKTTKYWNMNYQKHLSRTNAKGCVLGIKEVSRVLQTSKQNGGE